MKSAWVMAERQAEVRNAALAWKKAGAIDAAQCASFEALAPAARRRVGPVFRILAFFFVSLAIQALFGTVILISGANSHAIGGVAFFFSAALVLASELQLDSRSFARYGASTGLSFWAAVLALVAFASLLDANHVWSSRSITLFLCAATLVWAAAAWRWGVPVFALLAAVALFFLLARMAPGRTLWLVVGPLLALAASRGLDSARLAPSHRAALGCVVAVSLIAGYAALNRYSWDHHLLEELSGDSSLRTSFGGWALVSAFGTALYPLAILWWGWKARRTLLLDLGLILMALSFVTLRFYIHLAPLWVVLMVSGAAVAGLAALVKRLLDHAPDQERAGFTARPLFRHDRHRLEAVATVLAFAPAAQPAGGESADRSGGFQGGGGESGGGGASGTF